MILLVGAGAVGTILTTYLLAGGREPLKVYVRDRDLSALQTVDAARVDHVTSGRPPLITGKPALTTSLDLDGVDYVMLCVKFPDLEGVLEQIGDIPEGCTLISTLNGVNSLRVIRERFPHARVVPMSVMFNGQRLGPLHARITTKPIVMAGTDDSRLLDMFGRSGMQVVGVAGEAAVWGKLLINLANALGAATHTTFKDLFTHPDLRACYVGVLDEAIAVLHAAGKLVRILLAEVAEAGHAKQRLRALGGLLAVELHDVHRQQHVLLDGAPGQKHRRLEHRADAARRPGDLAAFDGEAAARRALQSEDQLQETALAATARAHDRDEFAVTDVEGDAA